MADNFPKQRCPDDLLVQAADRARADSEEGLSFIDGLITLYGQDPRLHFLRGSLLAGLRRHAEGDQAITRSLELDPSYSVARLQLGVLKATSGDGDGARMVLLPLELLPTQDPFRLFGNGLSHFLRDEWAPAAEMLEKGIEQNTVNAPLSKDMGLFLTEARKRIDGQPVDVESSAVHSLLSRYDFDGKQH